MRLPNQYILAHRLFLLDHPTFGAVVPFYKRSMQAQRAFEKPNRKTWYAGKPTRWHLAALKALSKNRGLAPDLLAAIRS
jgi:hypothetical protein